MCHFAIHDKKEENTFLPLFKRKFRAGSPYEAPEKKRERCQKLIPKNWFRCFTPNYAGKKEEKKILSKKSPTG